MDEMENQMQARQRIRVALLAVIATAVIATGCGGDSDEGGSGGGGKINLVAYSTPQEAYAALIKDFGDTPDGKGIKISESYGGSGDQSRAVEGGQPADYVGFSLEPDMTRLVKAGIVAEDWNKGEYKGMVTQSVVVLIVRKGNPKEIEGWNDLVKDDVEVITPNPFTSGGARWNIMAAYGSQISQGKTPEEAEQFLHDLFANVSVQDDSARKSLQTFAGGKGDVLLGYENEAIFAQAQGEDIDYVVPDETILIENPAAVTKNSKDPKAAQKFLDYVYTPEAQAIFVENGYRPVVEGTKGADDFPTPKELSTIEDFGGWSEVTAKFFDPKGSIMVEVERGIGVQVES
jgi:sulfate transport system substrate-binding protein